ncbi:MAG TPA: hypothetical protein VGQ02_03655 [Candidatus Limnocylindrales bacterium]|jgi:hypothetical protein|nr:hypothetical protein [Candidatus Limnocylindrales bacterium]
MSRSALLARPVSGTARTNVVDIAQLSLGTADVRDPIFARNLLDGSHTVVVSAPGISDHSTVALANMYLLNPG